MGPEIREYMGGLELALLGFFFIWGEEIEFLSRMWIIVPTPSCWPASQKGVDGEVFNIVDDDLPTSRGFLKMYKKNVRDFRSIYVPYRVFYLFCYLWEKYSNGRRGNCRRRLIEKFVRLIGKEIVIATRN